jgi:putative membrane-bound dehydrogenase-like protein
MRTAVVLFCAVVLVVVATRQLLPVAAAPRPGDELRAALPRIPPKEPAEALKTFKTRDGFRLELLAAEPLVTDPIVLEYDEDGRGWVVEMLDYPYTDKSTDKPFVERTTDLPLGRIRVLEDTDGDGTFDKSWIFADNLSWPTGLAFWKGGIFVTATPDVWYLKDTDGDGKADVREKVFTGFRKFNVQAVINNLRWGLDHKIYGAGATNGGKITRPGEPSAKPITLTARDFRFDPRAPEFELLSGGARFGNTFDDWGNRFLCNIRNPIQHIVLPAHYLARNPYLVVRSALNDVAEAGDAIPVYRASPPEPWRVINAQRLARDTTKASPRSEMAATGFMTSACGVTVYRGTAYPPEYYGNVFLAEVAGNIIHREVMTPTGVTFTSRRAEPNVEFVASTDNWFRPVNFVNAPDGTLHVCDMYRETIEHPWSIPDDIKAYLDLESGRDRGRLYRLAPPNFRVPPPPRLGKADTAQLVAHLENANSWWRDTAHRLLFERQDQAAVPLLRKMLHSRSATPAHGPDAKALGRLHALWSLQGLGALSDGDIAAALDDPAAGVREHGVQLGESRLVMSPLLRQKVGVLAQDPSPRVRFQVALTLGSVQDPAAVAALAEVARRDAGDEWTRSAILSSVATTAGPLLALLTADERPATERAVLYRELGQVVGAANRPGEVALVLDRVPQRLDHAPIVLGVAEGMRRSGKTLAAVLPAGDSPASRWVATLLAQSQKTARDEKASVESRRQAAEVLASGELSRVKDTLTALLDARQPPPLQTAAVQALASFRGPEVPALLLAAYRGLTPVVRATVVETLAARPDWLPVLLDAVEKRTIPPGDVSLTRRNALARHTDAKVRERAATLFGRAVSDNRKQVVDSYRTALSLASDRERGKKVFVRECQQCHRLGELGQDIGPNLATIQHRSPDEILLHVLDPNREVSPNFVEYVLTLKDGRVTRGIILSETENGLNLGRAQGERETVLRTQIDEIASTGISLMPEGLEKNIRPQEMADLLAFVLGK